MRKLLLTILMSISLVSCDLNGTDDTTLKSGMWRGQITLPGGELPFQLELVNPTGPGVKAYVINGEERVPVTDFTFDNGQVEIDFPAFNNTMSAKLKNDTLTGELVLTKRHGKLQHMPLKIEFGKSYRFFEQPQDTNADFAGRWRVEFVDDKGKKSDAIAEFEQRNGKVTGTFRTPLGDYRYLAGEVADRTLFLSTFDGAHAFLFDATMDSSGRLTGNFWSGTQWHESWTAIRDNEATLADPTQLTKVTDQDNPIVVEFPDVNGNMVRSDAEAYQDKVLIIALAGSWCPNCHDEAAFLSPFYREHRDRGLEIIGLMYEHLDDFDQAASQVTKFKEKFSIEYELLVAGSSDKSKASQTLPMLNKVIAFPTMIVLDRVGQVRLVHTGFNGPGTGEKYNKFRREFTELIEQLLNEEQS